jgi:dihydroneopterin aldolase
MTLLLATVFDAGEARTAVDGGADVIDFCDIRRGALGEVPIEAIAAAAAGVVRPGAASATIDVGAGGPKAFAARARALIATGVGALRLSANAAALDGLGPALPEFAQNARLVGVLFADRGPDFDALQRLKALGFRGAMLDVAEAVGQGLLGCIPPPRVDAFRRRCRDLGLSAWLAGSLQSPDVPRLLIVEPDLLGFDSALRLRGRREGPLDPRRIAIIRGLIPHEAPSGLSQAGPGAKRSQRFAGGADTIFVRDFPMDAEIGAYAHERGGAQRLIFNIEASVSRVASTADDMRAIVSYDVILDAVRIVVGRGHVEFLETVAEEVAAIVLQQPRIMRVRVRVEKLDVVAGSVGVEIVRDR